jgi:hypothetical protein
VPAHFGEKPVIPLRGQGNAAEKDRDQSHEYFRESFSHRLANIPRLLEGEEDSAWASSEQIGARRFAISVRDLDGTPGTKGYEPVMVLYCASFRGTTEAALADQRRIGEEGIGHLSTK